MLSVLVPPILCGLCGGDPSGGAFARLGNNGAEETLHFGSESAHAFGVEGNICGVDFDGCDSLGVELCHKVLEVVAGARDRGAVGAVVAGGAEGVGTRPLRSLPRQAAYGHGAERERGVLDALAARIGHLDGLLGGEAGVGVGARQLANRVADEEVRSDAGLKGKLLLGNGCGRFFFC